jgi:hypothetical protein
MVEAEAAQVRTLVLPPEPEAKDITAVRTAGFYQLHSPQAAVVVLVPLEEPQRPPSPDRAATGQAIRLQEAP